MGVGPQPDVLVNAEMNSDNVIICQSAPQLELLEHASVFVTHGGANSMHEALQLEVPLVVVPIFGDQPSNADAVARCGAGDSFRHPLRTLSKDALSISLKKMLESNNNAYRIATAALSQNISEAGGVNAAADAITAQVRLAQKQESLLCLDEHRATRVGGA